MNNKTKEFLYVFLGLGTYLDKVADEEVWKNMLQKKKNHINNRK